MKLIICVDDNNGMMFNKRRQSKDSAVRSDIAAEVGKNTLWMNRYSAKQFQDIPDLQICVQEDFLAKAEGYAFAECDVIDVKPEQVILYKWNRLYPADVHFNLDLSSFRLERTTEFEGTSHEKITKEVYVK